MTEGSQSTTSQPMVETRSELENSQLVYEPDDLLVFEIRETSNRKGRKP
jgi:hypothetical protein